MLVIFLLLNIQSVLIIFLINKIKILEKKNKFLQAEKSSIRILMELDKSINW